MAQVSSSRHGAGRQKATAPCQICHQAKAVMVPAALIRPVIIAEITKEHLDFSTTGYICNDDLNRYRSQYVQNLMTSEKGELTALDHEVLESLRQRDILSSNIDVEYDKKIPFGEALADKMADFGGSWTFIIIFAMVLLLWILVNALILPSRSFDPYPFILLNLVLSCVAAIQAPVIMMSQNRQEAKDRARAEHDYQVNLKAELEIRHLHEKIDHLLSRQWERLVEIQQIQIELMTELVALKDQRE